MKTNALPVYTSIQRCEEFAHTARISPRVRDENRKKALKEATAARKFHRSVSTHRVSFREEQAAVLGG